MGFPNQGGAYPPLARSNLDSNCSICGTPRARKRFFFAQVAAEGRHNFPNLLRRQKLPKDSMFVPTGYGGVISPRDPQVLSHGVRGRGGMAPTWQSRRLPCRGWLVEILPQFDLLRVMNLSPGTGGGTFVLVYNTTPSHPTGRCERDGVSSSL